MKKSLKERLDRLGAGERDQLIREAIKLRRRNEGQRDSSRRDRHRLKNDPLGRKIRMRRRSQEDLDDLIERLLDERGGPERGEGRGDAASFDEAPIVLAVDTGRCTVAIGDETLELPLSGELAERQASELAVGDRVVLNGEGSERFVVATLPRRTRLSRPDPSRNDRERVVAANIDVVVVVAALKDPPLRPGLIDRYLVAIEAGGGRPVIAVNKIDLLAPKERHQELARLNPYRAMDLPVVAVSADTGEGVELLRETLADGLAVLVGHSGVGKSSLLNALHDVGAATGSVGGVRGQGRHTTTSSSLYRLPDGGAIIDTPGVRSFGMYLGHEQDRHVGFGDIEELAVGCKFRDCTHLHEPGCAVQQAVAEGRLSKRRFASYSSVQGEAAARAQLKRW